MNSANGKNYYWTLHQVDYAETSNVIRNVLKIEERDSRDERHLQLTIVERIQSRRWKTAVKLCEILLLRHVSDQHGHSC